MTQVQKTFALALLTVLLLGALFLFTEYWMRFTSAFIYAAFVRAIWVVPTR